MNKKKNASAVFDAVYSENTWGDAHSKSGPGSNLAQTAVIRQHLPGLLEAFKVRRMLDAPCGDYFWMKEIKSELSRVLDGYIGADIVPGVVAANAARYGDAKTQFAVLDITKDDLPAVDLVFSRDCFIHLSYRQIIAALGQFKKSGATYLLTNTYTKDRPNKDVPENYVYGRALNLERFPFYFPKPLRVINEGCTEGEGEYADKSLALWRLKDISVARIKLGLWLQYKLPALHRLLAR
ncbi:MAG TPA: class I SAM-dependent methyltransferase [Cytophagales bacterium]